MVTPYKRIFAEQSSLFDERLMKFFYRLRDTLEGRLVETASPLKWEFKIEKKNKLGQESTYRVYLYNKEAHAQNLPPQWYICVTQYFKPEYENNLNNPKKFFKIDTAGDFRNWKEVLLKVSHYFLQMKGL